MVHWDNKGSEDADTDDADADDAHGGALLHGPCRYPLAVKLGTITPHGADVYSYAPDEDNMVKVWLTVTSFKPWIWGFLVTICVVTPMGPLGWLSLDGARGRRCAQVEGRFSL